VFVVCMEIMKMSALERLLLVVRICPAIMLNNLTIATYTLILPWLSAGVVAFLSSLNHFHMEMEYSTQKPKLSFVQSMVSCTQDYTSGPIWDWFTGGLARHASHHLFPTLPHWKLAGVADDVEQLLAKYKVQYNQTTFLLAVQSSAKHLYEDPWEWMHWSFQSSHVLRPRLTYDWSFKMEFWIWVHLGPKPHGISVESSSVFQLLVKRVSYAF